MDPVEPSQNSVLCPSLFQQCYCTVRVCSLAVFGFLEILFCNAHTDAFAGERIETLEKTDREIGHAPDAKHIVSRRCAG